MKVGDIVKIQINSNDKKTLAKIVKFIDDDKCKVQYNKWSNDSGTMLQHKEVFRVDDIEEL